MRLQTRCPSFQNASECASRYIEREHQTRLRRTRATEESEVFLNLVDLHQTRSRSAQLRAEENLKSLAISDSYGELSLERFKIIADWYHLAILELTELEAFESDPKKTCENFFDANLAPHILCNRAAFAATGGPDQYVLIHHEYAGLSGFETNDGAASQYSISNQLSEYLQPSADQRLGIVKFTPNSRQQVCASAVAAKQLIVDVTRQQIFVGQAMNSDLQQAVVN